MPSQKRISRAGLSFIKQHEGLRLEARRLDDGRYVIGHGHTQTAREGARVTEEQAEALLLWDLRVVEQALNTYVFAPLTQNAFDALASFALNVGVDRFRQSDVVRALNAGQPLQAAAALDGWRRARINGEVQIVDALVRRRAAEKALFLADRDGPVAASSAHLRPEFDVQAAMAAVADQIAGYLDTPPDEDAPEPPVGIERVVDEPFGAEAELAALLDAQPPLDAASDTPAPDAEAADPMPAPEDVVVIDDSPQQRAAAAVAARLDRLAERADVLIWPGAGRHASAMAAPRVAAVASPLAAPPANDAAPDPFDTPAPLAGRLEDDLAAFVGPAAESVLVAGPSPFAPAPPLEDGTDTQAARAEPAAVAVSVAAPSAPDFNALFVPRGLDDDPPASEPVQKPAAEAVAADDGMVWTRREAPVPAPAELTADLADAARVDRPAGDIPNPALYGGMTLLGLILAGAGLFDAWRTATAGAAVERMAFGPLIAVAGVVLMVGGAWYLAKTLKPTPTDKC